MSETDYVDAHFHMWDLQKFDYLWPNTDTRHLFRNFGPRDVLNSMKTTPVQHGIFIQVLNNNVDETKWVLEEAQKHTFIKGVVGGIDLTSLHLEATLDELQMNPLFKGVRHILDLEDSTWLTRSEVHAGLGILQERGLTFDLLLRPPLLTHLPDLGRKFPRLRMIIDHIAKPYIKDQILSPWKEEMAEAAKFPNIYCKISGLVTEANLKKWTKEDIKPYVQHVLECFGVDHCVFGSDFPVFKEANAEYRDIYKLLLDLLIDQGITEDDRKKIFKENAVKFYNLALS
ncbi:uncharacterized protein y4mH-like isoform X2 [Gigantopelta aegis]|uniref:uncharacterized protein y4mH-like isoform X2 n=1 Tax=Gigantopelta aegis TaxID=1735272 RepID=UPI001B888C29|nr:uncharacterized protein y4mH-like isoform X2 [Gigantopelta aegis]